MAQNKGEKIKEKLTYKNEFILHLIIAVRLYSYKAHSAFPP